MANSSAPDYKARLQRAEEKLQQEAQKIYQSVCAYLAPPGQPAAQVFPSRSVLEGFGEEFSKRPISSEQDLESLERFRMENYVRDIIAELCKISAVREEFQLGDGVRFDNHANTLDTVNIDPTIIMTVEYKPSYKLSVENLRAGLRPLRYNTVWLTGSAEGLEYLYLTNRFVLVLLQEPLAAVARVLCLCLMSFRSEYHLDYTASEYTCPEYTISEYMPSSSPAPSPANIRRIPARSRASCASPNLIPRDDSDSRSDSEANQAQEGRKRGYTQQSTRHAGSRDSQSRCQDQQYTTQICTQKCLHTLQQGGQLDVDYPNVKLHRRGENTSQHLINANIDQGCTPLGGYGVSGAPFKVTYTAYGYTMIGKETTSQRWDEVSREVEVYRVLQKAQGSAVPIFPGAINLHKFYFVHGVAEIRHMLIMAWGGEPIRISHDEMIAHEIDRSKNEILSLGVVHQDLRLDSILWNAEFGRALIIDFHCSKLDH
ncbi:hypothetical protein BO71DRAFT_423891 [Aspergillus ellipticus CBS 707.79]|uniref:Protein kinase domain-containing protein n=1 Tax=Aspergillus ellipticus CBS 707.79 TaxID=1448320 RepID=A0A319DAP0_9EURO|nr:hypothetical protein BO71DRAFT_423891 [Aspergillus ellipticus CBS 707.79]